MGFERSVGDFARLFLGECDRKSSKGHKQQTKADCYRNRELSEGSSTSWNSEEVSQLIEALHSMTNSVNCRSAKPLSKEDRFDSNHVKYRRFIKQFESYVLRGVHHTSNKLELTDKFDVLRGRLLGNHNDFHWQLGGQINSPPGSYKAARVIRCTELDSAVSSF